MASVAGTDLELLFFQPFFKADTPEAYLVLTEGVSLPSFRQLGNWGKAIKNLGLAAFFCLSRRETAAGAGDTGSFLALLVLLQRVRDPEAPQEFQGHCSI